MSQAVRTVPIRFLSTIKRLQSHTKYTGRIIVSKKCTGHRLLHTTARVCTSVGQGPPDDSGGPGNGDGGEMSGSGSGDKGSVGDEIVLDCPKCGLPFTYVVTNEEHARFIRCSNCHHYTILNLHGAKAEKPKEKKIPTPKEIKEYLDCHVVGQTFAKMILSVAVFNHYKKVNHNLKSSKPERKQNAFYTPRENIADILQMSGNTALGPHSEPPVKKSITNTGNESDTEIILDKSNILMLGPTGSGKTLLAQHLAKVLDVPFAFCDCTTLTSAGYVGEDIESVIGKLLQEAKGDVEKCQRGIVFLDEVDKIARERSTVNVLKDVGGEGVQQAMLKMLEGTVVNVPEKNNKRHRLEATQVDTTNILFIAAGAFNGLDNVVKKRKDVKNLGFGAPQKKVQSSEQESYSPHELHGKKVSVKYENEQKDKLLESVEATDLIDFGLVPEFVGRMPVIVPLHSLTEEMLVRILTEPQNSLIKQYQQCFLLDECQLEFTDDALKAVAHIAMEKQTGARGLRTEVEKCLLMPMYEQPGSDIKTVIINEDVVKNDSPAIYIHDTEEEERQSGSSTA
ncbi:ATP-dependent Clp protease ATP-binding subunit clpX-like, mitochondrial [Ruditapes philippinarum]|uniref:ATP-dependent Clp protease ATP-binding subunit clpX-like, mitochondrial n=1 Tax=Ruditapes philippinarum TaxID=129788 RepID=UPI00295AEF4B|nr:ATP-dependent Clp protease ATP-binding subunit clpX-like, mitochondrial [Ruditapes philippinarum]XP_060603496.1 ATP-dependent Clp protease ATP-binding subunit clpX-like, mitochondrial [Ruditapes philippinarum]